MLMGKRIIAMLTAVAFIITMTGTFRVFADEYESDNMVNIGQQGLSLNLNDVRIGSNPWVGDYTIGTPKKFTATIWVGSTNPVNVRRELKIYGTGTISNFQFNNKVNDKDKDKYKDNWVPIKEYNTPIIPKAQDENGIKREFQVTFNKAGRYIVEFNLYGAGNKLLATKKCDLDVTEKGITEHVEGNFTEKVTESPETITKEQPTTKPQQTTKPKATTKAQTTTKKVGSTKVKSATKKKSSLKAKISLKKVSGVSGYQIQISATKTFKKVLVKKSVKKYSFTISSKKIKGKKKLYVRARAYKTVNKKKSYGSWTKAKKMTIKK